MTIRQPASSRSDPAPSSARPWRPWISALATTVVVGALVVVVASAVSTSSARFGASTTASGFLSAAEIDLQRIDDRRDVLLLADGLYPGATHRGCAVVSYRGSTPASIRLHGTRRGGTGLDDYLDVTIVRRLDGSCEAATEDDPVLFTGRLVDLWRHDDFTDGIELATEVGPGERVAIEVAATLVDDNRAQSRTTDFALTIEARAAGTP